MFPISQFCFCSTPTHIRCPSSFRAAQPWCLINSSCIHVLERLHVFRGLDLVNRPPWHRRAGSKQTLRGCNKDRRNKELALWKGKQLWQTLDLNHSDRRQVVEMTDTEGTSRSHTPSSTAYGTQGKLELQSADNPEIFSSHKTDINFDIRGYQTCILICCLPAAIPWV